MLAGCPGFLMAASGMRWIVPVVVFSSAAILVAVSIAAERRPPPLTKLELRRAPQDQVKRRIFEQLSEALILPDQSRDKRPVRPLDEVWLHTRAYATATPGLCRSDLLIVTFLPAGPEKGAATPVRAAGLKTSSYYRFLKNVHPEELESLDRSGRMAANADCAAIDVLNTRFIGVTSKYDIFSEPFVVSAMWRLRRVVRAAAQEGELPYRLRCIEDLQIGQEPCRKMLSGIDPDKDVASISKCDADEADAAVCWYYSLREPGLSINIFGSGGAKETGPASLVQVSETLALYEERID